MVTNPMSDAELEQKFRGLVGKMLPEKLTSSIGRLWRLDGAERVRDLLEAMTVPDIERSEAGGAFSGADARGS